MNRIQAQRYLLAGISSVLFFSMAMSAQPAREPSQSAPGQSPQPAPAGVPPAANVGIESVKPLIKATDEEWKVIGPKLQAVVTARQAVMTYTAPAAGRGGFGGAGFPNFGGTDSLAGPVADSQGFGGGRGGRGRGPGGGGPPADFGGGNNVVSTALAELKTVLAESTSTPEQIKAKVAAVRSARQKAAADLTTAQKNLLRLLTADQEVTLLSLGYLD